MIVSLRIDERLIHGQVAMTWSKSLQIDGIIVANDETANNDIQKMTLKMAVPSGIKCIIKTVENAKELLRNPKGKNMRLMVLTKTVKDAVSIAEEFSDIEFVNVGNVGKMISEEKTVITKEVSLTVEEIKAMKELVELYPETIFQATPAMEKHLARNIMKNK
ncbi:PTS system sorbose subfamily IIB component [Clostridium sp. DL-VIII]|uniref:PTS sugar transporter subunit IIB n=1 Tax=Clostridium sp. DL-VIII TaxID=641107 RepID=UPI00023B0897|nr:PTS sugar transporter subunit IIB [Clostridium sp. DL-VIII]EHJ01695.1 PTS system sorbose subfamily IIB component [Clostridium sp. DL-VIII]